MSGGGSNKTEAKSEPWSAQQPGLTRVYSEANRLYGTAVPNVYYGTRVAPFRGDQLAAQAQTRDFAAAGGGTGEAKDYLNEVISGKYLDPSSNPYLGQMAGIISDKITPQVNAQFEGSGRYGGGANSAALGSALGDSIGQLYFGNYAQERDRQQQAAGMIPAMSATELAGINALNQSGAMQQAQTQAEVQAAWDKFNDQQNLPWTRLGLLAGAMGAGGSYPTQTTRTPGPSTLQEILGAGLGIGGLALPFFG